MPPTEVNMNFNHAGGSSQSTILLQQLMQQMAVLNAGLQTIQHSQTAVLDAVTGNRPTRAETGQQNWHSAVDSSVHSSIHSSIRSSVRSQSTSGTHQGLPTIVNTSGEVFSFLWVSAKAIWRSGVSL